MLITSRWAPAEARRELGTSGRTSGTITGSSDSGTVFFDLGVSFLRQLGVGTSCPLNSRAIVPCSEMRSESSSQRTRHATPSGQTAQREHCSTGSPPRPMKLAWSLCHHICVDCVQSRENFIGCLAVGGLNGARTTTDSSTTDEYPSSVCIDRAPLWALAVRCSQRRGTRRGLLAGGVPW